MSTLKVNTVESATTPTVIISDGLSVSGVSTLTGGLKVGSAVTISDNGNFSAKLKLDNSEGGRELDLGMRINDEIPPTDWWETGANVQRTIKEVPNDVLNYIGLGFADDQIRIKFTLDTSTWSAILEKTTVI